MEDFDQFHKLQSNPNVMRYTGDLPKSADVDRENLSHVIACYDKTDNDFWVWAVEQKSDCKLVGTCALLKTTATPNQQAEDEIGYRFIEDFWGNGYATEITHGLMHFAFTEFGKEELVAEVDELNIASVKILEKQMNFIQAYYSEKYKSNDRKYGISKIDFLRH
jgi:RimJ/RimL family protein N-acetyltransferase